MIVSLLLAGTGLKLMPLKPLKKLVALAGPAGPIVAAINAPEPKANDPSKNLLLETTSLKSATRKAIIIKKNISLWLNEIKINYKI